MGKIGFILLTHTEPKQILRLIRRLSELYGNPPIALHHDFGKCPLDVTAFRNVKVVTPFIPTQWGDFSVVTATLEAMKLLRADPSLPEWFAVLSGADYPVKRPELVIADLESGGADTYLDYVPVHLGTMSRWGQEMFQRYVQIPIMIPRITPAGIRRTKFLITNERLTSLLTPFSTKFRCFAGANWFTLNRKAVEYVLEWHNKNRFLENHLYKIPVPEEAYFQCILCNQSIVRVDKNYYRYIDWRGQANHPRTLDCGDLDEILRSGAHFARKFSPDDEVLDRLDESLGLPPWQE